MEVLPTTLPVEDETLLPPVAPEPMLPEPALPEPVRPVLPVRVSTQAPPDDLAAGYLSRRQTQEEATYRAWESQMATQYQRTKGTATTPQEQMTAHLMERATAHGLPPEIIVRQAQVESNFNQRAQSPKGAMGVMQLMPATAKRFGVTDPWDVEQNIEGGLRYMAYLQRLFPGRLDLQLAAYNAGEGAVKKYGNQIPPYPETQAYVAKILGEGGTPPEVKDAATGMMREAGQSTRGASGSWQAGASGTWAPPPRPTGASGSFQAGASGGWVPPPVAREAEGFARGFLSAAGNLLTTPASLVEAMVGPASERTEGRVAAELLLGPLINPLEDLGNIATRAAQGMDFPAEQKAFSDKLAEGAGSMAAYWLPAIISGGISGVGQATAGSLARWSLSGPAVAATFLEAFGETNETYRELRKLVGVDEAAQRAGKVLGANVLLIGLTNAAGFGNTVQQPLLKILASAIGEGVLQEWPQYEIQRRQFWVPSDHPAAVGLKAQGWQEADGRVFQPFEVKTAAEAALVGMVLGGSAAAGIQGLAAMQQPPAQRQALEQRIQAQDPTFTLDALRQLEQGDPTTTRDDPARTQTLQRWRGYLNAEMGGVALPGGDAPQPVPPAAVRLAEIDALLADAAALGEAPPPALVQARLNVAAELAQEHAAMPPAPEDMPQQPSPPPYSRVGGRMPTLRESATGLPTTDLRDAHGRWRIPLASLPAEEVELQDFIRKPDYLGRTGIKLAGETDVAGKLRALITRKETGTTGLHNDANGRSLAEMAEAAAEAGFIPTADKVALLEALDRSVRQNQPLYSLNATGWVPVIHDPGLMASYADLVDLADTFQNRVAVQRRAEDGPRRRADVHERAKQVLDAGEWTQADLEDLLPGTVLNDDMASVVVQQLGRMLDRLNTAVDVALALPPEQLMGSPEAKSVRQHLALLLQVDPQRIGVVSEAGRSLGILTDPLSPINRALSELDALIPTMPDMTERQVFQKLRAIKSQAEQVKTIQAMQKPGFKDMFLELWINGMMGVKTLGANMLSNTGIPILRVLENGMAGVISQIPGLGSGQMHPRAATDMVRAMASGMADGWVLMERAWVAQQEQFESYYALDPLSSRSKAGLEYPKAVTAANVGLDPDTPFGKMFDFWAEYIGVASGGRLVSRALMSQDEFAKGVNFRMELAALASNESYRLRDTPEQSQQRLADILTRPDAAAMRQAAGRQTILNTFQQELTDARGVASGFAAMANITVDVAGVFEVPLGRIVAPFVRISANLARFALERSPLGWMFADVATNLRQGGAARDMELAKMTLGSMTMGAVAVLAGIGVMTGRGPEDRRLKEQLEATGWRPYSLKIGNTYYPMDRLDPFATQLGIAADIVQIARTSYDSALEKYAGAVVVSVMRNLTSRTYMQGVARFFEAITAKSYQNPDDVLEGVTRMWRGFASSLVPSPLVAVERFIDPEMREVNGALDAMYARIPGWSSDLPYDRNKWGHPKLMGWGYGPDWVNALLNAASPIVPSTAVDSPINAELARNKIGLGMPNKVLPLKLEEGTQSLQELQTQDPLAATDLKLTPEQYDRYLLFAVANTDELALLSDSPRYDEKILRQVTTAAAAQIGLKPPEPMMSEEALLNWLVQQPTYQALQTQDGPDGAKRIVLQRIDALYRDNGRLQFFKSDPELEESVLLGRDRRTLLRTPATQQDKVLKRLEQQQLQRERQRLRIGQ